MKDLKQNYENACNAYLKAFCDKHGFDYDPTAWVGNDVGSWVDIADYCIDINIIRLDIDRNAPEDEFVKWYDYYLRLGMLKANPINYDNWLKGCPPLAAKTRYSASKHYMKE